MRWRVLLTPPLPGVDNMALDEALLERARETGEAVARVYTWARPTLSLGRNQTAAGCYDLARAAALGVDVVRRPTGGRAVLHHRELTYAVAAPAGGDSLRDAYARVTALLLHALHQLGVPATRAVPAGRTPIPGLAPCFELPTRDELVVDGQKLVGSAQWREEGAFLQHGSILVDDDQGLIGRLSLQALPAVPPPATLRQALGRAPDPAELHAALLGAVREREDPEASAWEGDAALAAATARLRSRYADDGWTWRR